MIKPKNTTENKITKETSMFNNLGIDYNSHSLEHQLWYYETELILQMKLPEEDKELALTGLNLRTTRKLYAGKENLTEAIIKLNNVDYCLSTGLIKNEQYYDGTVKFKQKKTMKNVWNFLYKK